MSSSRVPQVIDYLVGTFAAASTLGQATPPVLVLDGPAVTGDPAPLVLWVGVDDPDVTAASTAAMATQNRDNLGGQTRSEQLTVHCTAQAWSGADSLQTVRLSVAGIVAAVETLLRADPRLGGNVMSTTPGVSNTEWRQTSSTAGSAARVTFTIDALASI